MTADTIEFEKSALRVDAAIIAEGLGIEPSLVQTRMREGKITARCERGIDEDAGRYRLTFFSGSRRFRLVVDQEGNVIQRSIVDFGGRELPGAMRKPAALPSRRRGP
jgi:Family of unknown function (DUF6522)